MREVSTIVEKKIKDAPFIQFMLASLDNSPLALILCPWPQPIRSPVLCLKISQLQQFLSDAVIWDYGSYFPTSPLFCVFPLRV